jgi:hypothetical protein
MTEEEILLTALTEKQQDVILLLVWGAKKRKSILDKLGTTQEEIDEIGDAIIKSREDSKKRAQELYR